MIIVIAGKQSTCPNEKQKDSRRVSNLVLTAHAGTFIRPRNRAGNACVPHLGATENWTIEQLALMHGKKEESNYRCADQGGDPQAESDRKIRVSEIVR